jgi:hypothetical protein
VPTVFPGLPLLMVGTLRFAHPTNDAFFVIASEAKQSISRHNG